MKIRAAVLLVLFSFVATSEGGARPEEVRVLRSPTSPWIEVYHDGVLTSEWQPSDGTVYRSLVLLLDDNFYTPRSRSAPMLLASNTPSFLTCPP